MVCTPSRLAPNFYTGQSIELQALTNCAEDFRWARFEVQRLENHGSADDGSLLLDSGTRGKVKHKDVGVGESLRDGIFWCLDDLS
jgi:hypothetical protein